MSKLFTPYNLSGLALKNRVVMAPMTRTRTMNDVPDEVVALYYAQRASAGLLITEGMPVSEEGRGYLYTPGIYNDEHVQGWRKVTQAVHAKGGRIFAQLWHVGRMSHVSLQPGHIAPVSAGTVQAVNTTVFALTESGEPGPLYQASHARWKRMKLNASLQTSCTPHAWRWKPALTAWKSWRQTDSSLTSSSVAN